MGIPEETEKLTDQMDDEVVCKQPHSKGKSDASSDVTFNTRIKTFRHYYQHPYARLFVAYFVTICNFFIYAEDPVAHSRSRCEIPVVGNAFSMVFTKYPANGFSALKFFMWLTAIFVGLVVGKLVIHRYLLRRKLKMGMFKQDQGSWVICFFFTILVVLLSSAIYNLFLSLDNSMKPYIVTGYIGASNHTFMRAAALGTWFGDFITAWMVTDMMLQETVRYENWLKKVRKWWVTPWYRRVVLFWSFTITLTVIVVSAVCSHFINWDKFNRDAFYTNEVGRAFLASFILVMDFTIVMQDWDFPKFQSSLDIKLPGVNTASIKFEVPDWIKKDFVVHVTGKWFQYGVLFMVLLLDLNMWKNQIFYEPLAYGQYVGEDGHIFSALDAFSLANFGNKTIYSYDWRNSTIDPLTNKTYRMEDYKTNSRYRGYSKAAKGMAFLPSLLTFVVFALLIHIFGKVPNEPTENDKREAPLSINNTESTPSLKGETSPKGSGYGSLCEEAPAVDDVHVLEGVHADDVPVLLKYESTVDDPKV